MQKINLKLTALIALAFANMSQSTELDLNATQSVITTAQNIDITKATNSEIADLKEKVCAALAVLKCTLYKLESILAEINVNDCCENDHDDNNDDDDCPSLDFDDCDDCDNTYCDSDNDATPEQCKQNKLPINLNFDCHHNKNVKIYLKLQTCKKLNPALRK